MQVYFSQLYLLQLQNHHLHETDLSFCAKFSL